MYSGVLHLNDNELEELYINLRQSGLLSMFSPYTSHFGSTEDFTSDGYLDIGNGIQVKVVFDPTDGCVSMPVFHDHITSFVNGL